MIRKAKKGHVTSVDPKKGRVGSQKWEKAQADTKAKKQKRSASPRKPPAPHEETSITRGIYRLFEMYGPNNVTLEQCLEVAKAIKPTTAFTRWHMYYHRKIYKQLVAANADPFNPIGIRPKGEVYLDEKGIARLDTSKAVQRDKRGKIIKPKTKPLRNPAAKRTEGPKTMAEFFALQENGGK